MTFPIHCKAAIADGSGRFLIDTVSVYYPGADEVLVAIKAAGLCHTDYDSLGWGHPVVMGHEGAGIVMAVGSGVTNVRVGDAVILNWATPCKQCFQCQLGNLHICEENSPVVAGANGYTRGHAHKDGTKWKDRPIQRSFNIGTLSEYTLVKSSAVVLKSLKELSFRAASIISCGIMTGYGSVVNSARVKPASSVVVLGTGGVGLSVVQAARICRAQKIIAVDINENRLEMAKNLGATHLIKADRNDSGLLEADYAFECTAVPELGAAPLAMVRNAGMAVQVSGIEQEITIDMSLFEWDKLYINPLYGGCNPERDFPKIVAHYKSGDLKLEEMITRTYSLDDLQQAFDDMLAGKNAKGAILFE